jgi:hypothetical protein
MENIPSLRRSTGTLQDAWLSHRKVDQWRERTFDPSVVNALLEGET